MDARTPFIDATLDGRTIGGITEVRVSRAIGSDTGVATISTADPATFSVGGSVAVAVGWGGAGDVCFIGFVARAEAQIPRGGQIEARDRLERMRFPWGGSARVYRDAAGTPVDDASVIRNLLEAYDIASQFASIEQSFLSDLAVAQPIYLNAGDVPWNLIRELDELSAHATFCRGNGSVYRRPLTLGSPAATFTEGVDIISARRVVTRDGIESRVVVRGLEYEGTAVYGTAQVSNGDAPSPPGYVAREISSNIVETPGAAGSVADAYVARFGATPDEVEVTVLGTTDVDLGDTFALSAPSLGAGGSTYLCTALTHTVGSSGFTTTIRGRTYG